jgi:hypothetical protein
MEGVLVQICAELEALVLAINQVIPDPRPLTVLNGSWNIPSISRDDLADAAASLRELVLASGDAATPGVDARMADFPQRLQFLRANTVPQLLGSAPAAVPAFMETLAALRSKLAREGVREIHPLFETPTDAAKVASDIKRVTERTRAMEARLSAIDPKTASLAEMVARIERAYEAADQLPTDLESLAEARAQTAEALNSALQDAEKIVATRDSALKIADRLDVQETEAERTLALCESAYAASTSVGLAAAFSERSKSLAWSMSLWVFGLIGALAAGAYFGSSRLESITAMLAMPSIRWEGFALNMVLSLLSIGGPIWFAWLSTKQIGQRFRLAEDYAFKASISRAYEGYRKEAARIDPSLEKQLLASALARLDEAPLRLVEAASHGSPWQEVLASDSVREAIRMIPGFAAQVSDLAKAAIASRAPSQAAVASTTTVVKPVDGAA